jgi:catechol 2,3-dioxygenase
MFGLETYDPIEKVLEWLRGCGVRIASEIIRFEAGNVVAIEDCDGNPTYVHEFPPEMLEEADRLDQDQRPGNSEPKISGGHALVLVSNMDRAVSFYRDVLGLKLTYRFEDKFATLEAGKLVVALHPTSSKYPAPGTRGSVVLGLQTDEPIDRVVAHLATRGVRIGGSKPGAVVSAVEFEDSEGNTIELTESRSNVAEATLQAVQRT